MFGEDWPAAPRGLLSPALAALSARDPPLRAHLDGHLGGAAAAVWALLSTCFSDCLHRDAWLQAMDHLLAAPCGSPFAACLAAALLLLLRPALMHCRSRAEAAHALCSPQPLPIDDALRDAYTFAGALARRPTAVVDGGLGWLGAPNALVYPPLTPLGARAAAEGKSCAARLPRLSGGAGRPQRASALQPVERVDMPRRPAASALIDSIQRGQSASALLCAELRFAEAEAEARLAADAEADAAAAAESRAMRRRAMRDERVAAAAEEAAALEARIEAARRDWEEATQRADAAEAEAAALRAQASARRASPRR